MFERQLFLQHLDDGEEVSAIVHRHWLVGVTYLWWPVFCTILGVVLLPFVLGSQTLLLAFLAFIIGSIIWGVRNFFDYYLDSWIVTNQGIIDLEWHGWFHRESSRILYTDIQGVSYEIQGVMGTILNYGVLNVEKISSGAAISLQQVPQPKEIEAIILRNMETYVHAKNMKNAKHVQELLATLVAEHVQLKTMEENLEKQKQKKAKQNDAEPREKAEKPKQTKNTATPKKRIIKPKS